MDILDHSEHLGLCFFSIFLLILHLLVELGDFFGQKIDEPLVTVISDRNFRLDFFLQSLNLIPVSLVMSLFRVFSQFLLLCQVELESVAFLINQLADLSFSFFPVLFLRSQLRVDVAFGKAGFFRLSLIKKFPAELFSLNRLLQFVYLVLHELEFAFFRDLHSLNLLLYVLQLSFDCFFLRKFFFALD